MKFVRRNPSKKPATVVDGKATAAKKPAAKTGKPAKPAAKPRKAPACVLSPSGFQKTWNNYVEAVRTSEVGKGKTKSKAVTVKNRLEKKLISCFGMDKKLLGPDILR